MTLSLMWLASICRTPEISPLPLRPPYCIPSLRPQKCVTQHGDIFGTTLVFILGLKLDLVYLGVACLLSVFLANLF